MHTTEIARKFGCTPVKPIAHLLTSWASIRKASRTTVCRGLALSRPSADPIGYAPPATSTIGGAKGAKPKVDTAARKKVRKPHKEWNSIEIISKNGAITSKLNGAVICQSEAYELTEGPIGFQSEGAPIDFRNIRIKVTD